LVFSNQKVLLPELAFEDFRINFYSSIASRLKNSVHMIVYDLIPIIGPEFNSNTEPFVNYCRLLRHVDQAICISKSVANDVDHFSKVIIRENRKPLKVSTAYLGADFAPPPSEHRDLTNKSDPIPKILVVGTFEPRKNQIAILRAAHLLHSEGLRFKVVFAGNPGWKNEAFFTELDNLDPGRKFTEIIFQATDQELAQLYDQCKFTVFYSHLEGFGLPILESLNFGKPVLYANRGAMAEITKGLEGCIPVEPDNPMSLSAILKETILSRSFAMQSKVRNAIIENYSWRRFAQVLYESIQS
jgi:glycosyltransferase involved in cell wall biosynthesis